MRIAYLIAGKADLFEAIGKIQYRDYQGKMAVYFGQERNGRLIDILEGRDGSIRFALADGLDSTPFSKLSDVDLRLIALYEKRVAEIQ